LLAFFTIELTIQDMTLKSNQEWFSRIQARNQQRHVKINIDSVVQFCSVLLEFLELQDRVLSVAFISARVMKKLNAGYRNKNYATDVLSFSYDQTMVEGAPFLGEIIIAAEVAANQAVRHGVSPDLEFRKLLLHGMLHLMGYDHETDAGQMNQIQRRIMRRRFFVNTPPLTSLKEIR
jgi:probable rRNA maturation factor